MEDAADAFRSAVSQGLLHHFGKVLRVVRSILWILIELLADTRGMLAVDEGRVLLYSLAIRHLLR